MILMFTFYPFLARYCNLFLFHQYLHVRIFLPSLNLTTVTEDVVIYTISKLDPKKATGCDNLPIRFIKACPEAMSGLLTKLINKGILTGKFPELWKSAIVTPVQKSRDSSALSNFRPVSVLPGY